MSRVVELDGLRGLAAAVVVAFHLSCPLVHWGWAAVDVFFVLSGYLITTIVLGNEWSGRFFRAFYARRALRIWPIYYLAVAVLFLTNRRFHEVAGYYASYTQEVPRYWGGVMARYAPLEHAWTLALEEQFYLFWPPLVLLAGRRWTPALALAVASASVLMRASGFHHWLLVARCDGFALGGFLAAMQGGERARLRAASVWAAGLAFAGLLVAGLAFDPRRSLHQDWRDVTAASLASFVLVALTVRFAGARWVAPLRAAPLAYLGTISYGVYLYHQPIIMAGWVVKARLGIVDGPAWEVGRATVVVAATLGLATASWFLVERPILELKKFVPYDRRSAPKP